jgi:hypothetical protein
MAGKLIIDTIQTEASFLQMNVSNTLVATINSSGILNSSGGIMVAANGRFSNTALTGTITGSQISSNTIANTNIQTGAIENYSRDQYLSINRNKIINGDMKVDQRKVGANTVIPAYTATYVMDRWFGNAQPNASKFSMQQMESANSSTSNYEANSAPNGYTNSMKVNSTTAMSVSTGEIYYVAQRIEGYNTYRLGWGAAGAKTVTLSFWVKSSVTGTLGGSIVNSANDYCYPFSYTIVAANTWEQKFITITGATSGTWKTDFNIGIQINFALATGSSYTATAGSWTSSANIFGATGQTNVLASQGNTWYLTGVQFEVGGTASNFEYRHYQTELAMCQRYYQKSYPVGTAPGTSFDQSYQNPIYAQGTGNYGFQCGRQFPVALRATPTFTVYSHSGVAGQVTPWNGSSTALEYMNANSSGITGGSYGQGTTSTVTYGFGYVANAEL